MTRHPSLAAFTGRPIPLAPQGAAGVQEMILRDDRRRDERSLLARLLGRGDEAPAEKPAAWTPTYLRGRAIVRPSGLIVADGVAVIDVRGPLMDRAICWYDGDVWVEGYDRLTMMLQEAEGDEAIGAVMLRFDTPGGLVDGLESFAAAIGKVSAAGKPVHGFVGSAALSAGYWAIVSCDKVVSAPEGLVGSIGVIIMHAEYSKALAEAGAR
ncbi:S49 family peptidase [Methylobrevis pamukkalensis]|uniref:Putative signal peptide peptidase SppA n=1 Tax=Methylobrevis pamukkalensis TaxID=1439726 RepID=A0A1E3H3V5_9HYPH|nr:S49 family peptidase [Methylobrevis pamukkalensis]ODN70211.1 putative signal peptide peptidase SppA [Methylobrevis pamukkalensis]